MKTGDKILIELTAVETKENFCNGCVLYDHQYCDHLKPKETPCKDENIIFKIDETIG